MRNSTIKKLVGVLKTPSKATAGLLAMTLALTSLTGCGAKTQLDVSAGEESLRGATYCYLTQQELDTLQTLQKGANNLTPSVPVTSVTTSKPLEIEGVEVEGTEVINDTTYYKVRKDLSKRELSYLKSTIKMNKDSFVCVLLEEPNKFAKLLNTGLEYDYKSIDFSIVEIKMPFTVNLTNGTVASDKHTVTWDLNKLKADDVFYATSKTSLTEATPSTPTVTAKPTAKPTAEPTAVVTKQPTPTTKPVVKKTNVKLSGVANNGYIRKAKTVKIVTNEKIKSIKLNNKTLSASKKSIKISKEGKYSLVVKTNVGTKKFKFTLDKTKPTTNIKAKTYTKPITIKVKDKLSGVKRI